MEKILDVGCGQAKTVGAIGMDMNPATQADILADANNLPWPFKANAFDRIVCRHIVEHVTDLILFMEEVHRVGRPGAVVEIITPHFSNRYSFTDPTHLRHLGWRSFDYFTAESAAPHPTFWQRAFESCHPIPSFYTATRFHPQHRFLDFGRPFRVFGIQWLANRCPDFYEHYLTFILPARDLHFVLEVSK
jgi:ubiquinone/menaquinone biosynthesis C-methylase UbiE